LQKETRQKEKKEKQGSTKYSHKAKGRATRISLPPKNREWTHALWTGYDADLIN